MSTQKKRVRVKENTGNPGGRPRSDLKDVNTDELILRVPAAPNELIDETAKEMWKDVCAILIHRKQLKPSHLPLVLTYCNAFAVTIMKPEQLLEHGLIVVSGKKFVPAPHVIFNTYSNSMCRCMQMLRLDPKGELYNCLAKAVKDESQYIDANDKLYDQF